MIAPTTGDIVIDALILGAIAAFLVLVSKGADKE